IEKLGVRVFRMEDIAARGVQAVLADAVAHVSRGAAGYGITLDIDAIDPADAPGTGTPVPGGIPGAGLIEALKPLALDPGLVALEIAEYNPYRDQLSRTRRLIEEALATVLSRAAAPMLVATERKYSAPNYDPLPAMMVRASGSSVWDVNGRRYIDMMSAYS